jgi:opacity protein-like surface antigen
MINRLLTKTLSVVGVASAIFAFSGLEANAQEVQKANNSAKSGKAADLLTQTTYPQAPTEFQQTPVQPVTPAQAPLVSPGRATRGGSSYIGVGGNLGIAGETTLSEGSFAVISKIGLTNTLSVRPAALIGDNAVFLIPVTLDFPVETVTNTGQTQISASPYVGAGVSVSTADDSNVGFLISGGLDVPVADQLTANAALNVSFLDDTNVGLLLGVGYNF